MSVFRVHLPVPRTKRVEAAICDFARDEPTVRVEADLVDGEAFGDVRAVDSGGAPVPLTAAQYRAATSALWAEHERIQHAD